jgi:formylglycine-generating enzyme required for sulfatase activity
MSSLGTLGDGIYSAASAVSEDGAVVVGRGIAGKSFGAFIWHSALGMVSLRDHLASLGADLTGWSNLITATGVSANGQYIVGNGIYNGAERAYVVNLGAPPPYTCTANAVPDSVVDGKDLATILSSWGSCEPGVACPADLSGDCVVDGVDLAVMLGSWGPCPVVPDWAILLDSSPDPAVVFNSSLRESIRSTGHAWRVRDRTTQIEMVLIPPGTFQMGCSAAIQHPCASWESPVHPVVLTSPIYMGRYEVTQAQWSAVMGSNPSHHQGSDYEDSQNRPVESISWFAIQEFVSTFGARLPTEAEWEFACRAGTTSAYHASYYSESGSNDADYVPTVAWISSNSLGQTHRVGQLRSNGFGLHDIAGNVAELVADWNGSYSAATAIDPTGPSTGSAKLLRGGSWYFGAHLCRSSSRNSLNPHSYASYVGFRVARNP